MALTNDQRERVRRAAEAEGHDPDEALALAERLSGGDDDASSDAPASSQSEKPKLFQYHLPFITVRELRSNWLGLEARVSDDEMLCGEFAAKHGGAPANDTGGETNGNADQL